MGTALKMGPAYFPTVLGGLLAFIGVISLIRSFVSKGEPIPAFAWKPLLLIVAATVVFGLLVRGAGLAHRPSAVRHDDALRQRQVSLGDPRLLLAAGDTVFCVLVFVKGLGVPLPHHRSLVRRLLRRRLGDPHHGTDDEPRPGPGDRVHAGATCSTAWAASSSAR